MAKRKRTVSLAGLQQAHATTKMRKSLLQKAAELHAKAARYEELAQEIKDGLLRSGAGRES